MQLKVGTRMRSTTCSTEVIVVRAVNEEVELRCGGRPMIPIDGVGEPGPLDPAHASGSLLGKRYTDAADTVEVLVTKAGDGSLSLGADVLTVKDAKRLPSSD